MTCAALRWAVAVTLVHACVGCSLVSMAPPGAPGMTSAKNNRERCKNIWYPLADTASALAGVAWIVRANDDEALNGPEHTTTDCSSYGGNVCTETTYGSHHDDTYKYERVAGYSILVAFAASAIYGYAVTAECDAHNKARVASLATQDTPAERPRHGFPDSVEGFSFALQAAQAAQLCASKGETWELQGSTGSCKPAAESATNPDVRLEFELGAPTTIVLTYHPTPAAVSKNYGALYASLLGFYGAPQVKPGGVSTACAASLGQCLADGESPTGPVWHWAGGTIALSPIWKDDRAVLELRYSREEPQAQ